MPCWTLVFTSIGFFIPAFFAAKLKKHFEKNIIRALATTSVLYHGTVHPLAQFLDTCVAHFVAVRFVFIGIHDVLIYRRIHDVVTIALSSASIYMYYMKSLRIHHKDVSQQWHMKVHITAQLALLCYLNKHRLASQYEIELP